MKTQQALLSTVMMWPFLSTATPFGPINLPAPILFCDRKREDLFSGLYSSKKKNIFFYFINIKYIFFFFLADTIYLKFAIWGEDANPSVVIVSYNDVTVHVHCDSCGALQLSWRATSDPKPHLKLTIIWEYLPKENQSVTLMSYYYVKK